MTDAPDLWLNAEGAARHLSITADRFRRLVTRGKFPRPCYHMGQRSPRWLAADLDRAMKQDTASTNPRIAVQALVEKMAEESRARRQAKAG